VIAAPNLPAATLKERAETLGQALPPLLAEAERLASAVMLGEHGRRRSGLGDEFWQYRPAHQGDSLRLIDWRRSARSDAQFVREREWQAAQSVTFWVDPARSMAFAGDKTRGPKSERAQVLALALAVLLLRGGERVGLAGGAPPKPGRAQLWSLAMTMAAADGSDDYGVPDADNISSHGRAVFLSDFLGDLAPVEAALAQAAAKGARVVLVQCLDPAEEEFPFDGRTIFESMGGTVRHETLRAGDLRARYLDRLAARKDRLRALAAAVGGHFHTHHTGTSALPALLWAYRALEGGR
jgi:uncharacterized protein (DUF58 family)